MAWGVWVCHCPWFWTQSDWQRARGRYLSVAEPTACLSAQGLTHSVAAGEYVEELLLEDSIFSEVLNHFRPGHWVSQSSHRLFCLGSPLRPATAVENCVSLFAMTCISENGTRICHLNTSGGHGLLSSNLLVDRVAISRECRAKTLEITWPLHP